MSLFFALHRRCGNFGIIGCIIINGFKAKHIHIHYEVRHVTHM